MSPVASTKAPASTTNNNATVSVAENVSLFLNGIFATFRQDNVNVSSSACQKKADSNLKSLDGKQTWFVWLTIVAWNLESLSWPTK